MPPRGESTRFRETNGVANRGAPTLPVGGSAARHEIKTAGESEHCYTNYAHKLEKKHKCACPTRPTRSLFFFLRAVSLNHAPQSQHVRLLAPAVLSELVPSGRQRQCCGCLDSNLISGDGRIRLGLPAQRDLCARAALPHCLCCPEYPLRRGPQAGDPIQRLEGGRLQYHQDAQLGAAMGQLL